MNNPITHYLNRHETVLRAILQTTHIPATRIKEAITHALFPGGKRFRPILVYLCGELLNTPTEALDSIAAAIELMHCYSLIHDDLPAMDDDDIRRGRPSCHRAFDEATAILAGDGLQALAIESLLESLPAHLTPTQVIAVSLELLKASGVSGMVSGQSLDLSELCQPNITTSQLEHIHTLKTGKLISSCINMVLFASTPSAWASTALQTFAKHLGLVFQMQDDYLDAYGHALSLGKGRSSDRANQKTTFASLYNQQDLHQLIHQHFQLAKDALNPFKDVASPLLHLINTLEERQ